MLIVPEISKGFLFFGPNRDNLGVPVNEFLIILTQLRHVSTAVRSAKTPIEHKDNVPLAPVIRETYCPAFGVSHSKVGSNNSLLLIYHVSLPPANALFP